MITIQYRVEGRVQGVYFRASTQRQAQQLGVTGWVRNCDDGAVELVATGTQEQHVALQGWLRIGPPSAKVRKLEQENKALVLYEGFEIKY